MEPRQSFRRILPAALAPAVLALTLATPALAVTTEWNKGLADLNPADTVLDAGTWLWTDAANWTAGVPANGDTINFKRYNWAQPIGINTTGATLSLGNSAMTGPYAGSVFAIFDSTKLTPVYKASPVPNTLLQSGTSFTPVAPYASLAEASNTSPALTLASMNFSKEHYLYLYHPLNKTGNVTDSSPTLAYPNLTLAGLFTFVANHADVMTKVPSSLTIGSGGTLKLAVAQNALPAMSAQPGSWRRNLRGQGQENIRA